MSEAVLFMPSGNNDTMSRECGHNRANAKGYMFGRGWESADNFLLELGECQNVEEGCQGNFPKGIELSSFEDELSFLIKIWRMEKEEIW